MQRSSQASLTTVDLGTLKPHQAAAGCAQKSRCMLRAAAIATWFCCAYAREDCLTEGFQQQRQLPPGHELDGNTNSTGAKCRH